MMYKREIPPLVISRATAAGEAGIEWLAKLDEGRPRFRGKAKKEERREGRLSPFSWKSKKRGTSRM